MIVYASRTGNVRYICSRINLDNLEIEEGLQVDRPFILATYTDGLGQVPLIVQSFMRDNAKHCIGIIVSGNRNFGTTFANAGDVLQEQYGVPIIRKLDLRGQAQDFSEISKTIQGMGLLK